MKKPVVLLIDDAPANLHTLCAILSDVVTCKVASSGEAGLRIAQKGGIDLILLDVVMPFMDGYATCNTLKSDAMMADIPVIFVTAKDSTEEEAYGFSLGAVDYVAKPFHPTIVRARVMTHLRLKALSDQLKEEVERELSKRLAVQKEFEVQTAMLNQQAKLAAMGEMIGAIAHQWRQPLNALNMQIQNLEDDFDDGVVDRAFIEAFIARNRQTILFMSKTIDDFRNFFKKSSVQERFMIVSAIEETLALLEGEFKHHHIESMIEGERSLTFDGVRSEFQQVILNLLTNAKDAIIAKGIPQGKIIITLSSEAIWIADNGGGIDEGVLERIFEPYFTTKEQGKGTGIGLYMSKMIVEKNRGCTLLASNAKEVTLFTIVLN